MDRRLANALDRYITGNYGEDSVPKEEPEEEQHCGAVSAPHWCNSAPRRNVMTEVGPESALDDILDSLVEDGITQFRLVKTNNSWTGKCRTSAAAEWTRVHGMISPVMAIRCLRDKIGRVTDLPMSRDNGEGRAEEDNNE